MLAATAASVMFVSGTASASDTSLSTPDHAGAASWTENGDTLRICDNDPDGWGVRAYVYRPNAADPWNGTVLIKGNDPKFDNDCTAVSEDVDEYIRLSIKVCLYKGASIKNCSYRSIPGRPFIDA